MYLRGTMRFIEFVIGTWAFFWYLNLIYTLLGWEYEWLTVFFYLGLFAIWLKWISLPLWGGWIGTIILSMLADWCLIKLAGGCGVGAIFLYIYMKGWRSGLKFTSFELMRELCTISWRFDYEGFWLIWSALFLRDEKSRVGTGGCACFEILSSGFFIEWGSSLISSSLSISELRV